MAGSQHPGAAAAQEPPPPMDERLHEECIGEEHGSRHALGRHRERGGDPERDDGRGADDGSEPGRVREPADRREPSARQPLLVTADERLLDDLVRLATAVGAELTLASDPGSARAVWTRAPLVLVGADQAAPLARSMPPRRRGVVVVGYNLEQTLDWRRTVQLGADDVVSLPEQEVWLSERLADALEDSGDEGVVVGVIGGRGGAGASTFAAALAITAANSGRNSVLVDADPLGGGLDLVLGAEATGGLRWPDLIASRGRIPAAALRSALPRVHGLALLSYDRGQVRAVPTAAMRAVLGAARRFHHLIVVDLPRHLDEAGEEALRACSSLLLVVPTEIRAAAAAGRVARTVAPHIADIRLVARGPSPAGLAADDMARGLDLPLTGELPPEPGLAAALERGDPPARNRRGPLSTFCTRLLDELGIPRKERR